jgi:hypothetical protein
MPNGTWAPVINILHDGVQLQGDLVYVSEPMAEAVVVRVEDPVNVRLSGAPSAAASVLLDEPDETEAEAEQPAAKPITGKKWLYAAVEQWGKPDKIDNVPKGITEFARILKAEMTAAHARGKVKVVFDADSADSDDTKVMQARLHEYKLWPVKPSK